MIHFIATTLMISASASPAEAEEGPLYDFTPPGGRQPNWQEIELQKQKSLQQVAEKQFRSLTTDSETQKALESLTGFGKPFQKASIPNAIPIETFDSEIAVSSELDKATNLSLFKIMTNPFEEIDSTIISSFHFDRFMISSMWEKEWCALHECILPDGACGFVNLQLFEDVIWSFSDFAGLLFSKNQTDPCSASSLLSENSLSQKTYHAAIAENVIANFFSITQEIPHDEIRKLLSMNCVKNGTWNRELSSIQWVFYELGELTWIVGIDPQNHIVSISSEPLISQWPREITILYDRYSVEPTEPASRNVESIFNAF